MDTWAKAWKCEKESHWEESSHWHSFSYTSTTSRPCFPDMSPTPSMLMISPCKVYLNTPHLVLTESRKQWTNDWGLKINEVKTQATVFSLSTSKEKLTIKLGDKTLSQVETPTVLRVTLDTWLSWKPHRGHSEKRHTWEQSSTLEYGASAWATAVKTHTNKLDKLQNIG